MNNKRLVVLDTETTGINNIGLPHYNHRIIEIGAVEIMNRHFTEKNFHVYIQPNRKIDSSAFKIHGITDHFLLNKPTFKDIVQDFLKYIKDCTLIIHNATFDIGFIEQEMSFLNMNIKKISDYCSVIDTLKIARELFPGKKNTLDALCTRYKINISQRNVHSAILDARLLGKLYLLMTGGQKSMFFLDKINNIDINFSKKMMRKNNSKLKVIHANAEEIKKHREYMNMIKKIFL
ncbi:DNA polymerase III subunit epsilon [Buchnera aphidicola]|uniref:DNA polymerase III subunit epsilon n=1 Tax=Buchnera aphidicola TaxID=9 RepID=UPI003464730A